MNVDGQTVRYAHGPQVGTTVQWPGRGSGGHASIELLPQTGGARILANGPWALHRLLVQASLSPGASPAVTVATFEIGGRRATLEITAHSAKSPFRLPEMTGFACPGRG